MLPLQFCPWSIPALYVWYRATDSTPHSRVAQWAEASTIGTELLFAGYRDEQFTVVLQVRCIAQITSRSADPEHDLALQVAPLLRSMLEKQSEPDPLQTSRCVRRAAQYSCKAWETHMKNLGVAAPTRSTLPRCFSSVDLMKPWSSLKAQTWSLLLNQRLYSTCKSGCQLQKVRL